MFDFGVQASQLSNQSAIYSLAPEARSRVTTAYMVAYFTGAVAGSISSGYAYGAGGWVALCVIGLATSVVALALWAGFDRWNRRKRISLPA